MDALEKPHLASVSSTNRMRPLKDLRSKSGNQVASSRISSAGLREYDAGMTAIGAVLLLLQFVQPPCAPTPTEPLLPSIVDSAIGNDPVWLVDGSSGHFPEKGFAKTLWIFKARTPVRVRGHELGTGAAARLRHQGLNGPISYEMVIEDARVESVLPGGAGRELLDVYAFIPSYVFYPRRGCY